MRKNYIKLIGSIIGAFSMVMTVALVAIGAQANDKEIAYVKDVTCSELKAEPTAPTGYDRASGYLFAGWYEEGGDNKNAAGYSPVSEPVVGQSYVAKYVPSEVLGVKAQVSGQIVDNDTDKIQNNAVDNAIRFVTSLDSTEYNHIGFNIKIAGTDYDQDAMTTKSVYKTVYGIGADKNTEMKEYKPNEEFHEESVYFKTYTFTAIPESAFDSDITVTPYWITLDGTRVEGTTGIKTVNLGRSWIYVNSNSNSEVELGTLTATYKTMANAVAHDTELNLKVILKSNVTVSETINIGEGKNITITDDGTARSIIRGAINFDMINVETGATLTLSSTGAVGDYKLILDGNNQANTLGAAIIRLQGDVSATLNIYSGVKLQNNASGNGGAGIAVESPTSTIYVDGAYFGSLSAGGNGGAIYLKGTGTINNSIFKDCSSEKAGGAIIVYSSCDITDTKFDNCSSGTHGGAIYNSSGNLTLTGTLSKALFYSNETGDDSSGGAIYMTGTATLTVTGYTFEENSAKNGGAIYVNGGICNIKNTKFDTCNASNAGAAIYSKGTLSLVGDSENAVITNCCCSNSDTAFNTAIYLNNGTLTGSGYYFEAKDDTNKFVKAKSAGMDNYNYGN